MEPPVENAAVQADLPDVQGTDAKVHSRTNNSSPKNRLIGILVILIISLTGGIGYLLYQNSLSQQNPGQTSPNRTDSTSGESESAPDDLSDWITYTNSKWNFEFKYPVTSDLIVPQDTQDMGQMGTPGGNAMGFYAVRDLSPTIAEYLEKSDRQAQTAWEGKPSLEVKSSEKTVMNGMNIIRRDEYLFAADLTRTVTYFKKGTTVTAIYISPTPSNPDGEDNMFYETVLSTFRFIQSAGAPTQTPARAALRDTTEWATVGNGRFTLKYPDDEFEPKTTASSINLNFKPDGSIGPDFTASDYDGGSRRVWYNDFFSYSPGEVTYTEKLLGNVNALYAFYSVSKHTGYTVSSGKTIVLILPQGAETKTIETIISTIVILQ